MESFAKSVTPIDSRSVKILAPFMNEENELEEAEEQWSVPPDRESHQQWRAVVFWLGIVFASLIFYVFGFPRLYLLVEDRGWLIPGWVEAAFFRSVHNTLVWDGLPEFPFPARFVGGDPAIPDPGTSAARWVTAVAGDVAARVSCSRFTVVPNTGHMMVCERPDRCRDLVFDMIYADAGRQLSAD